MPAQVLRPYQLAGVSRVLDAWKKGARSVLFVLPTGGGKTSCFAHLASEVVAAGRRAVLVVHRRELATQAAKRFAEFGTDFGYVMSGAPSKPYARMQIASVQTLVRRRPPPAELVIFDEAHLSTARTWQQIRDAYPRARVLGVTATPWRLSGRPLVGAYDDCVVAATPRELREQGFLCDYVGFSYLTPDLSDVKTTAGEYNEKQSSEAMKAPQIVDNVVEMWLKHAAGLSTVVFNVTVEHSQAVTARFRAAGVAAEHLDGKTSLEQRKAILARVESGVTRVLCNVGIAVEGIDIPRLKCVVLNRPTKSLALMMQQIGRGRRPWEGRTLRIHDHAFNIKLHGLPDADRDYTLNAKPELPPSLTQCQECFALYVGSSCPGCGSENEVEPQGERELVTVADAEQFEFGSQDEQAPEPRNEKPVEIRWDTIGRVVKGVFAKRWDEDTSWGKRRMYLLRGDKRDYSLPGTVRLNALMAKVKIGDSLVVTHTETKAIGGGKERKEFKLEVDDGEPEAEEDPRIEQARRLYVDDGKSTRDVATEIGASPSTIKKWGRDGGWIRTRSDAISVARAPDADVIEKARRLYVDEKQTTAEVGEALGVSGGIVAIWGHEGGWMRTRSESLAPDPLVVEEARRLYVDENKTAVEVGEILSIPFPTVAHWGTKGGWLAQRTGEQVRQRVSAQ